MDATKYEFSMTLGAPQEKKQPEQSVTSCQLPTGFACGKAADKLAKGTYLQLRTDCQVTELQSQDYRDAQQLQL